ncbi:hypothetical protein RUND412_010395 [Rhizina undulata]
MGPPQTPQGPTSCDPTPTTPPRRIPAECPPTPRIPVRETFMTPGPSKRSRSSRSSSSESEDDGATDNYTFQSPPDKHQQDADDSFVLDPAVGIPTPAKTPSRKSKHYNATEISSSSRTLFPSAKKGKSSRLDLSDNSQPREPEFEIFTDSSAKVPKLDLSADNPFVKHPGEIAVPHEVKKRVAGRERERRLGRWAGRSDGFVSFHRSRKIFTPFAPSDRSSPTPGAREIETDTELEQECEASTSQSFIPRLLFPPPTPTPKPAFAQTDDPFNSTPAPPSAKKKGKGRRPAFLEGSESDSETLPPPVVQKPKLPAPASLRAITPEEEEDVVEGVKIRRRNGMEGGKKTFGLDGLDESEEEFKSGVGKKRTSVRFDVATKGEKVVDKTDRPVKRAKKEEVAEKSRGKNAVRKKAGKTKATPMLANRRITRSMAKATAVSG